MSSWQIMPIYSWNVTVQCSLVSLSTVNIIENASVVKCWTRFAALSAVGGYCRMQYPDSVTMAMMVEHPGSIIHAVFIQSSQISTILLLHYTHLTAYFPVQRLSQYQKGKISLDLNEARDDRVLGWQWHQQLDHMQTICTLLETDNHTNTSSLNFYRLDGLPDAQPTVSKHWR